MDRNYTNESNWQKKKYTLIHAYIEKDLGDELKKVLKENGETIANWIRTNAKRYLGRE